MGRTSARGSTGRIDVRGGDRQRVSLAPIPSLPRAHGGRRSSRRLRGEAGFHRIRHYGLFASATRKANITRVRELMAVSTPTPEPVETEEPPDLLPPCPCCGGRMRIIETFECWMQPRAARSNWGAVVTRRGSFPRHAVAPANDTSRAHGRAGVVTCADPCRHRRKTPTSAPGYRS